MHTRPLEKRDFDTVVQVIDRWWGGPTSALAHPMFFHELGALASVAEHEGVVVGFLLGFLATPRHASAPVGYIHLVGVHPDHRRKGIGRLLYQDFEARCREARAESLKAIATLGNEQSHRFHQALGWDTVDVADYAGPGRPRSVFTRQLGQTKATP